ncbi:hypothetical protein H072_5505 [Dactylellina haptotyla CBS 200.50]|uniref:Uncharacterized protein n=1 Tax=Dactylellina haptotyla (strain CBS 200.50) TaxID=1284197 RepID=S8BZ18_DACHA|nr:hypothetical protein H072_5505 [Dactylellina haptotyla CBS 200.50]
MEAPPTPSGFQTDKPILSLLNIDLLVQVASNTFLHPLGAWMLPLSLRSLTFQYHHPPLWGSILYAALVTLYWLSQTLNRRLAYGASRPFDKTEEVLVVTGGASGLGLLIAQVYGMRGLSVAILDVNKPEVHVRNVQFYKCDVGNYEEVKTVSRRVIEELGQPTILINNAAVAHGKTILDLNATEIRSTFDSNVLSNFWTIKEFLPGMIEAKKGTIVTISSALSHIGPKQCADYSASKAAVRLLHEALTAEVAQYKDIKTLLVCPGQISTPLFDGVETPSNFFAPILEPVDVAKEIMVAIDSGIAGTLEFPLYARWIVVMQALPVSIQRFLRWISGCDEAMKTFRGRHPTNNVKGKN